jgi:hypothetical protein
MAGSSPAMTKGRCVIGGLDPRMEDASCAGLTRVSISFAKNPFSKEMDGRVKPGHDEGNRCKGSSQ